jgi:hypothetical protein
LAAGNPAIGAGYYPSAAAARGVPLPTILVTVAVLALTYLAAKLAYRLRDVLLLILVAGFIALILNPFVVFVPAMIPAEPYAVATAAIALANAAKGEIAFPVTAIRSGLREDDREVRRWPG